MNALAECTALACALWKRPRERVHVFVRREPSGYRRGTPWRAKVRSPGIESVPYSSPDRTDLDLSADGADEHAALRALREVLLRSASNAAEACVHAEARWTALASEERERGESLRALVESMRQERPL